MTKLVSIILLFGIHFTHAQDVEVFTPDCLVVYSGFDCKLKLSNVSSFKNVKVECDLCDTVYPLKNNYFVIRAGVSDSVILNVYKKDKLILRKSVTVVEVPTPILTINNEDNRLEVNKLPTDFLLNYHKSVPINGGIVILNWVVEYQNQRLIGNSNKFSQELKDFIAKNPNGNMIIELNYISFKGNQKMTEVFKINIL